MVITVRKWTGRLKYSHMGSPHFQIEFVSIWGFASTPRLCHSVCCLVIPPPAPAVLLSTNCAIVDKAARGQSPMQPPPIFAEMEPALIWRCLALCLALAAACQQVVSWCTSHDGEQGRGAESCRGFVCSRQFPTTEIKCST